MLTYAVGDVHGCLALLDDLLAKVATHAAGRPHRLVMLGDYVDRGTDSKGVVARIRSLGRPRGRDVVCLKGNHEDMLLQAAADPAALPGWLLNGGDATLASYGVADAAGIPAADRDWMAGLPTSFEDDRRCFVHAGLNPDVPERAAQSDGDRLWIREPFLESDRDFGRLVVHGHTPRRTGWPEVRRNRVNIDTAAVYGGRLTAAIFDDAADAPTGFLQAR